jgi:hypothetical protein
MTPFDGILDLQPTFNSLTIETDDDIRKGPTSAFGFRRNGAGGRKPHSLGNFQLMTVWADSFAQATIPMIHSDLPDSDNRLMIRQAAVVARTDDWQTDVNND